MADTDKLLLDHFLRRQEELLGKLDAMAGDMAVMTAMLRRLDGTMAGLVGEIRAEHARCSRLEKRVAELEASRTRSLSGSVPKPD